MLKALCVELQSFGVRMPEGFSGRKGGAGPAEGRVIVIDGHHISVPTRSWFVRLSPYALSGDHDPYVLFKHGSPVCEVSLPGRPRYYDMHTSAGLRLEKIALVHGSDCLASTIYQDCRLREAGMQCAFCGIGVSLAAGDTVLEKDPEDLAYTAEMAARHDNVAHVTLTTGEREHDTVLRHLVRCIQSIKSRINLPVHVQICPPRNLQDINRLKDAGADTIGIHIESCSQDVIAKVAPFKAQLGMETYRRSWTQAVGVFGRNQVSSFIIAGLGETDDSLIQGAEDMCRLGVFPYLLPLRPVPGSLLEASQPPAPGDMLVLYTKLGRLLHRYGLSSRHSRAGCVRCGACSAQALFEQSTEMITKD